MERKREGVTERCTERERDHARSSRESIDHSRFLWVLLYRIVLQEREVSTVQRVGGHTRLETAFNIIDWN